MRPRALASSVIPPKSLGIIRFDPPIGAHEEPVVVTLKGQKLVTIEKVEPGMVTLRNSSDEPIRYAFAIVPRSVMNVARADWKSLAAFISSLQQNLLNR